jgi:hypothetical protein
VGEEALAGKSTLNRLELSTEKPDRYKKVHYQQESIDELLTAVFLEAYESAPERIVLDLDVTINGGAIIDHEAPRERRFVAVEK